MRGKGINISLVIITALLFSSPCYADGGIPLWMISCSSTFLATGIQWEPIIFIISTLILLLLVSLVETFVIKAFLKLKSFMRAFWITLKANFVSTIVGCIITFILFNFENVTSLLWWSHKWYILNNLILHVIMLILSYYVEYYVARRDLADFKTNDIKKSFLFANILSYILFPAVIIMCCLLLAFASNNSHKQYEKINYNDIEDIVVTKSAFIPEPVTKKECKRLKKELGITAKCDADKDYWTGAVKACGGVEHLYSEEQFKKIIKKVYNSDYNDYFFNEKIAKRYGLPIDFLPPEVKNKHDFSSQEYEKYKKSYPMQAWIYTNKAYSTSGPFVGELYSRSGNFHSEGVNSNIYAICINNKK